MKRIDKDLVMMILIFFFILSSAYEYVTVRSTYITDGYWLGYRQSAYDAGTNTPSQLLNYYRLEHGRNLADTPKIN